MSNTGYCLYGFYQVGAEPLKEEAILGIDDTHPLEEVHLGNLAAVISQVPLKEFGEETLRENLQDIKWLEKHIRAYDEITRKLFNKTTFIPVRFGTIYLSKERISESIKTYKGQIIQLLNSLKGKVELGIKLFFNRKKLTDELLSSDKEVEDLKNKMEKETPGKAHFLKKKLDTLIEKKIKNWSDKTANSLFEYSREISSGIQLLSLQPKEESKEMFLNIACLLPHEKLEWFKSKIKELMSKGDLSSVGCEIIGPLPPYSFAKLESPKDEKESTSVGRI